MNLPSAAFTRNSKNLPHFEDVRRARGRYQSGGREDGTGYVKQVLQFDPATERMKAAHYDRMDEEV